VVKNTPVLAGVCGTDPFRLMKVFLRELKEIGFDGVQNFPTVGLIDGVFRQNLEETGMSYDLEVEAIALAHELDMLTCPYVFDTKQAIAMTKAGADIIVAHMGLTTKGSIGAKTALTLEEAAKRVQEIHDAMLTGESIPVDRQAGDSITGGTVNGHGMLKMRATRVGSETALAQIIRMVEEAQGSKAPIQRLADVVSSYFVPAVLAVAVVAFAGWMIAGSGISRPL